MIRRPTWILLAVLVVLIGVAVYLQREQPAQSEPEAEGTLAPTSAPLLSNATGNIVSIQITAPSGNTLEASRESGGWTVLQPQDTAITADELQTAVTQLENWTALNQLENSPGLAALGLEQPVNEITAHNADGSIWIISIGNPTPTGSGYYVQIDGQSPVVIDKNSVDPLLDLSQSVQPTETPPTPQPSTNLPAGTTTASP